MTASLNSVLRYKNSRLVRYFADEYGISTSESEELFSDLKKWLWLSANRKSTYPVSIFAELRVLDLYWHTFLLFTKDYLAFCEKYFGLIIYHKPDPHFKAKKEQASLPEKADQIVNSNLKLLERSLVEVVSLLGSEVAQRWYKHLPEKYGKGFGTVLAK